MGIDNRSFILALYLFSSFSISAAEDCIVNKEEYESLVNNSFSNTFEKWYLTKVDSSYLYIEIENGSDNCDIIKIEREQVSFNAKEKLPTLYFTLKWKESN